MIFIQFHSSFGVSSAGLATRISFVGVAIWWAGFAQITFKGLSDPGKRQPITFHVIWNGYRTLIETWQSFKNRVDLKGFLLSFFLLSMGVQTIILLATPFGTKVLGLGSTQLIMTILIIQFLAIGGAHLFAYLSGCIGNKKAIIIALCIWMGISIMAWSLQGDDPLVAYKFYAMGGLVGLAMGGIQSLARSTYSKMLPTDGPHTTFFSFYDVTEKLAIVIGTFSFGFVESISNDMHNSALILAVFFVASIVVLSRNKMK